MYKTGDVANYMSNLAEIHQKQIEVQETHLEVQERHIEVLKKQISLTERAHDQRFQDNENFFIKLYKTAPSSLYKWDVF